MKKTRVIRVGLALLLALAVGGVLWFRGRQPLRVQVENRSDGDIYGLRMFYGFSDKAPPKDWYSGIISQTRRTPAPGNNDLDPYHVGETLKFKLPGPLPDPLPEALELELKVQMGTVSTQSWERPAGGRMTFPLPRDRTVRLVLTGNADSGFRLRAADDTA